jgi:hypothetical protein
LLLIHYADYTSVCSRHLYGAVQGKVHDSIVIEGGVKLAVNFLHDGQFLKPSGQSLVGHGIQVGVFDGDGHLVGQGLQNKEITLCEGICPLALDIQDTQYPLSEGQWDSQLCFGIR